MARRPDILRAFDHLELHGEREPWKSLRSAYVDAALSPVLERFGMDFEGLSEALHALGLGDMFSDFCRDHTLCVPLGKRRQNLIDEYLKWRGWQESRLARRYLQALRASSPGLYEVTHVEPQRIGMRELISDGPEVWVGEHVRARSLAVRDRVAARAITLDEEVFLAEGLLRYPREATPQLDALLQRTRETSGAISWPRLLQIWVVALLERRANPGATLRNVDGESLVPSRARLPLVTHQPSAIARRLDALPAWEREQFDEPRWVRCDSLLADDVSQLDFTASDIRRVLASAHLADNGLTIDTNSRERMNRVLDELNAALQGLVGPPIVTHEDRRGG